LVRFTGQVYEPRWESLRTNIRQVVAQDEMPIIGHHSFPSAALCTFDSYRWPGHCAHGLVLAHLPEFVDVALPHPVRLAIYRREPSHLAY
jgi:hypothetical protein